MRLTRAARPKRTIWTIVRRADDGDFIGAAEACRKSNFIDTKCPGRKIGTAMDAEPPKLSDGEKTLIQAVLDGDVERTRQELAARTNVNVRNAETHPIGYAWNTTPLMSAAAKGYLKVARILISCFNEAAL